MSVRIEDGLTTKQRYAKKKHDAAPMVDCACGCGEQLKSVDKYARVAKYINGHNARLSSDGTSLTKWEIEKRWRDKNRDKLRIAKNRYYKKRKILAIELKGCECVFCGLKYNGNNSSVFDFHHLDPEYKEENISKMLTNVAWERTVKELEQCVLACANCHRLQHNQGEDDDAVEDDSEDGSTGGRLSSDQDLDE